MPSLHLLTTLFGLASQPQNFIIGRHPTRHNHCARVSSGKKLDSFMMISSHSPRFGFSRLCAKFNNFKAGKFTTKAIKSKQSHARVSTIPRMRVLAKPSAETEIIVEFPDPQDLPAMNESDPRIDMDVLNPPWFSRRKSSLLRITASSMRLVEEVRSPRPPANRRYEYVPLVLDDATVTSEGIEMEMHEYSSRQTTDLNNGPIKADLDFDDAASVQSPPPTSFLRVHRAMPTTFDPKAVTMNSKDVPVRFMESLIETAVMLSAQQTEGALPQRPCCFSRGPSNTKPRPVPLSIRPVADYVPVRPAIIQDQSCVLSDTPLSFRSMESWPDTSERTIVVLRPMTACSAVSFDRPGTAGTVRSELMLDGW